MSAAARGRAGSPATRGDSASASSCSVGRTYVDHADVEAQRHSGQRMIAIEHRHAVGDVGDREHAPVFTVRSCRFDAQADRDVFAEILDAASARPVPGRSRRMRLPARAAASRSPRLPYRRALPRSAGKCRRGHAGRCSGASDFSSKSPCASYIVTSRLTSVSSAIFIVVSAMRRLCACRAFL